MVRRLAYWGVIAAMVGLPQASIAGSEVPQVLTTVAPLKPYLDEILKGITTSQSLVRPGQDPHTFTLSPSQAQALDKAEIVVIPDAEMSRLFMRHLKSRPKIKIIELSKLPGADPLPYAQENPWLSAVKKAGNEHDDEDESPFSHKTEEKPNPHALPAPSIDPHFWLDPERMAALARPVADAIAEASEENKSTLDYNAAQLAQHLRRDVIPEMQSMLRMPPGDDIHGSKPEIPFITYHAAYQYFLARFHLAHGGEITTRPEDYLGAKTLDGLLNGAKAVHIGCVIGEMDTTLVRRIAALSGAKVVILSPEQLVETNDVPPAEWARNGYDRLLHKTAIGFSHCLK